MVEVWSITKCLLNYWTGFWCPPMSSFYSHFKARIFKLLMSAMRFQGITIHSSWNVYKSYWARWKKNLAKKFYIYCFRIESYSFSLVFSNWAGSCKLLKGQCHEIFCFRFFSSISFPPAPEYPIKTVSNFFENSLSYSRLKVDHWCHWHRWQTKKIFNQKNLNNFVGTFG